MGSRLAESSFEVVTPTLSLERFSELGAISSWISILKCIVRACTLMEKRSKGGRFSTYGGVLPGREAHFLEPHSLALLSGLRPSIVDVSPSSLLPRVDRCRLVSDLVRSP